MSWTIGSNSSLELNGTMSTLVGATTGGRDKTCVWGGKQLSTGGNVKEVDAYTTFYVLLAAPVTVF